MSRKTLGKIMVVIGAIAMVINVMFFKSGEYYDLVRRLSFVMFILGILLVPTYSKPQKD
ncbi:hypothetical protein [Bacillus atrophaeus]|uniref:hypothetical protein n=1 Tax=Bacillus atrophaeus TaxID=1452 RepID=UPI000B55CCD8|nr:hypothetical protein [Bacillus atrophaeus]ARW08910.1 hypothetical protein S101359_03932 [Bacillus atrophaeus]MED1122115.1 hypothetical protein [Bacillus atrophaeus]QUF65283.1 hypothetical protein KCX77_19890 [Bacillus atrophaeus]WNV79666.1 hypothetical protein RUL31_20345 [Bacillus atrophaeus]